jgi:hypothetical protein
MLSSAITRSIRRRSFRPACQYRSRRPDKNQSHYLERTVVIKVP